MCTGLNNAVRVILEEENEMKKVFNCAVVAVFVFGFSAVANAMAVPSEQKSGHSAQNGEEHAFNWAGEVEETPLKFNYNESFGGSDNDMGDCQFMNGHEHTFKWSGELEETPFQFNYSFGGPDVTLLYESYNITGVPAVISTVSESPQMIPEPFSVLLMGLGSLLVVGRRRKV